MPTLSRTSPYVAQGLEYAQKVVSGQQLACHWVRLACQRQLDDLERWNAKDSPFYFDVKPANRVYDFKRCRIRRVTEWRIRILQQHQSIDPVPYGAYAPAADLHHRPTALPQSSIGLLVRQQY